MAIKVKYKYCSRVFGGIQMPIPTYNHLDLYGGWFPEKYDLNQKCVNQELIFNIQIGKTGDGLCVQVKPAQSYWYSVMQNILLSLLLYSEDYLISDFIVMVNV
jgi:hypothetical protein